MSGGQKMMRTNRNRRQNNRRIGGGVNRVLESTGPDGKVRGNSQQIIEKYMAYSRDALLSGDRIIAENYSQHAEHYIRLHNQQKEIEAQRSAQHASRQASNGVGGPPHNARQHVKHDGASEATESLPTDTPPRAKSPDSPSTPA